MSDIVQRRAALIKAVAALRFFADQIDDSDHVCRTASDVLMEMIREMGKDIVTQGRGLEIIGGTEH